MLLPLLLAALGLPIVLVLLLAAGQLLAALGDAAGAIVVNRVALAGGIVWAADLISLVIVQGMIVAEGVAVSIHPPSEDGDEIELHED
jgi:hypothetical protein